MNRDVHVLPEHETTDDTEHVLSRFCWCDPAALVSHGWVRVVHHAKVTER